MFRLICAMVIGLMLAGSGAYAQSERVVDISTRPNVTQRFLFSAPSDAKAAVILIAGGHGGLQIFPSGKMRWGSENFVVRNRRLIAQRGLMVATIDAPSDRQSNPYLGGFRQRPEHVEDVKAVIAWIKQQANVPVWLVGTSRGTQSAAYIAVQAVGAENGPDGLVLTSRAIIKKCGNRN